MFFFLNPISILGMCLFWIFICVIHESLTLLSPSAVEPKRPNCSSIFKMKKKINKSLVYAKCGVYISQVG